MGTTAFVGKVALAGLPPLGGFLAEWLLLQDWLTTPRVFATPSNLLLPLAAALFALTAALAAYVMVKFYAMTFLGRPREPRLVHARDAGPDERWGLGVLAVLAAILGLAPGAVLAFLARPAASVLAPATALATGSAWTVTFGATGASYAPLPLLAGAGVLVLALAAVRRLTGASARAPVVRPLWACGSPPPGPRAQDTSEGFGQPIRRVFAPFFAVSREIPDADDPRPRYAVRVSDRLETLLYAPLPGLIDRLTRPAARLQQGRLAVYLGITLGTLVLLLLGIRWL